MYRIALIQSCNGTLIGWPNNYYRKLWLTQNYALCSCWTLVYIFLNTYLYVHTWSYEMNLIWHCCKLCSFFRFEVVPEKGYLKNISTSQFRKCVFNFRFGLWLVEIVVEGLNFRHSHIVRKLKWMTKNWASSNSTSQGS